MRSVGSQASRCVGQVQGIIIYLTQYKFLIRAANLPVSSQLEFRQIKVLPLGSLSCLCECEVECKPCQSSRQVTAGAGAGGGGGYFRVSCAQSGPTTTQLWGGLQDVDSMRTLTIGDRTISYDAGLDSLQPGSKSGERGTSSVRVTAWQSITDFTSYFNSSQKLKTLD